MVAFDNFNELINTAKAKAQRAIKSSEQNIEKKSALTTNPKPDMSIRDEFVVQKTKNGLFEKFYNKLKNWTNFGTGSEKVEQKITEYEAGKISKEEAYKEIEKYKKSQKNAEQTFGDVVAGGATISAFFKGKNALANLRAKKELNALGSFVSHFKDLIPKNSKIYKFAKSIFYSNKKAVAFAIPVLAIIGGYTKTFVLSMNRIGSKEFKVDKNLKKTDKEKYKELSKKASRASWKEFFKNFGTGAVGGILTPLTAIGGGFIGVPVYLAGVLGLKHISSNEKDKSFNGFVNSFKDNYALNTLGMAALTLAGLKKARYSSTLQKNLNKVIENLKNVKLKPYDFGTNKSSYETIKDILLDSSEIKKIIGNTSLDVDSKIQALTKENIFAVKFLQTSGDSSPLVKKLIEDCPPTRNLEQAQEVINSMIGSAKYKVEKLLGTGTVAETYLAKDASGKEVCIKILKNGINAEKIQQDKEAFIKLVTKGKPQNELTKEQDYIVRCIEDYAKGISKEVDLENEMKAAKELAKVTKKANVAVPIEAKPGVYVMEKAKGISVETLKEYYDTKLKLNYYKKILTEDPNDKWAITRIKEVEKELEKIKSKAPDFADFDLDDKEVKNILLNYIEVLTEQFTKINRNGKPIHADIHPGNIIINLDVAKGKSKDKLFTLIDTGNVINTTKQQSVDMLKFLNYLNSGNIKDLSRAVVADSILPNGITREKAVQLMEEELKKCFFNNSTKIEEMTADNFFKLTDNIQKKYNIIPGNTQLNLNKAKNAANESFKNLMNTFFNKKYGNMDIDEKDKMAAIGAIFKVTCDAASIGKKYVLAQKWQEFKNLFKQSPTEFIKSLFNRNNQKTNSVEYLTYKMKQKIECKKTLEEMLTEMAA